MRTRAEDKAALDPRSFEAVLHALLEHLRVRRYSTSMLEQAERVLLHFFTHLKEKRVRDLRAVSEAHVFAYARRIQQQTSYKGTPLTAETQRSYLMQVQRLFAFLDLRGLILQNPALDLVMPQVSHLPRVVLTEAQARRLIGAASPWTIVGKRDRVILEVLYGTGLRVSECTSLELKDVDLAKGVLFVRRGKGRKDRLVPIAGRAAAALEVYLKEARPELVRDGRWQAVFLSTTYGRALSNGAVTLIIRRHAKLAGLPVAVSPHTLRHSYATHLIQGGADVRHVQRLLGHSCLTSTAIYTRVFPKDLAKAVAKAHPRESTYNRRRKRALWRRPSE